MRLKRFFSAAMTAALLISLCACAPKGTDESGEAPAVGSYSGPRFSIPGLSDTLFGTPSSDPAFPPPPEYDKEYRLNVEIPALADGLEMPVIGATGYTSVDLPLWPSIPGETEDPEDAEDPDQAQIPSEPESLPGETATEPDSSAAAPDDPPVPGGPVDPARNESAEPAPDGSLEPAPDKSAEPVQSESAEPALDGSMGSAPDEPIVFEPELPKEPEVPSAELPENTPEAAPPETPEAPTDSALPEETEPDGEADPYADAVAVWEPGTAFVILEEDGDWWYVSRDGVAGWIEHRYCMINLPDVIPSIIYDDTNSYSSLFFSCGKEIPGVTGRAFYDSLTDNARLDRQEYMMPMLYSAARHICAAQHRALSEGNCLVIYQTFRPYDTQRAVVNAMSKLAKDDPEVKAGISTPPWNMSWFIATGVSNHQRGYALDVSMVKVYETETAYIGSRPYLRMTDFEDYKMPTAMHELSIAAISTISPNSNQLSGTMNEPAIALRGYFTASGLSPLPSEWWHFNDHVSMRAVSDNPSNGRYYITECLSCLPEQASELLDFYATESMETVETE